MTARNDWREALLREQFAPRVPEFLSRPTSTSDLQADLDADLVEDDLTIARRRRDLVDALDDAPAEDTDDQHASKREGA